MINKIDDVMFKIILKEYEASSVLNNAQRDKIASQVISRILRDQIDVE